MRLLALRRRPAHIPLAPTGRHALTPPLAFARPLMDAAEWDRRYADSDRPPRREPVPVVAELVAPLEPGRALDLAAGTGRNAVWLARSGWRVTAVDFSRVGLAKARERADAAGVEMEYVVADVHDYDPAPLTFDLVLIAYLHPEPGARAQLFADVTRWVAPGGRLLVVGLDASDPKAATGTMDPDRRFTPDRLEGAFPGIELTRCERVTRERETPDGVERSVDTVAWGLRRYDG